MNLEGQGSTGERGYAMAALLVMIGVMAVLMSAALPVWRHDTQREKEAELIFRGEQYVRAIRLFQLRMGNGIYPPSFDVLVQQHFLRKRYKDPITGKDFQPLYLGAVAGQRGTAGAQPDVQPDGAPGLSQQPSAGRPSQFGGAGGGIIGVVSTSKATSIRVYKGATHYNEWQFIFAGAQGRPGVVPDGQIGPDGRPLPGTGRGGRGEGPGTVPRPPGAGPGMPMGPGNPQPMIRRPGGGG